jgi:hypothetical protein
MKMHSACFAAKAAPALHKSAGRRGDGMRNTHGDMPAWKMTGVRCGLGLTECALTHLKYLPRCSTLRTLEGSVKT